MMVFTEDEVRRIIGKPIDIQAKFENAHKHDDEWCIDLSLEDDESEELVGEKIAYHSNFIAAVTQNELRDEQLRRMKKICGQL